MARHPPKKRLRRNRRSRPQETDSPSETGVEATIDELAASQSPKNDEHWDISVDDVMDELSGNQRLEEIGLLHPEPHANGETAVNSAELASNREQRQSSSGKRGGRRRRSTQGVVSRNSETARDTEKNAGIVVGFGRRFRLTKWRKYIYLRALARRHANACSRRNPIGTDRHHKSL